MYFIPQTKRGHLIKTLTILTFLAVWFMFVPLHSRAQGNTYPTPERLFHIERNKNRNLVCYDINLKEGKLNTKEPLNIYWINREENPGEKKNLSGIQRRFAYGFKLRSSGNDTAEVTLTAYPGRILTIRKWNGKYVCTVEIDNKTAILQSLYVKAKEGSFTSVEYVELRGVTIDSGQLVTERVSK